jgi:hypothetical protein
MLNLCLRSSTLGLLVSLALTGVSGCSNESLVAGDGGSKTPPPDGSAMVTGIGAADPAACGCQVDGYTLTISWDCFCAQHDCTQPTATISCTGIGGVWSYGCGFQEYSVPTFNSRWVYTDAGQLIGVQLATDDGVLTCPTDPSLQGYVLRAGKFPLDSCEAQTACPCLDGGESCPTPAALDGGTRPPPSVDAAI